MNGWGFILIYGLVVALGVVYFIRIFKRNSVRLKTPAAGTPPKKIAIILSFTAGLAFICLGQYLIAQPANSFFVLSSWLNTDLHFDTVNLDNVLVGLPFLWTGCYLVLRAFNRIGIFTSPEIPDEHRNVILPLRLLKNKLAKAVAAGLIFSILLIYLAAKQYSGFMPVLWIGSILIVCMLAWQWDRQAGVPLSLNLARSDLLWITGLVLAGLVVASFSLQNIPNQMIGDEGNFWTTARDIALGSYRPPVFGFGVYTFGILSSIYQGAMLKIFGITLWSWRFSSVLAGVAAIPALYLLGRELFNRRVAIASSIAMFTAPYFLAFARLGYNNIQTLVVVTLAFYLFYSGYRRKSAFYLFLAGCAAGLGTYTYNAAAGAFYVILLFLGLSLFLRSTNKLVMVKTMAVLMVGWLMVSFPYSVYGHATAPTAFSVKPLESIFFNTGFGTTLFGNLPAFFKAPRFVIDQTTLFFSPSLYAVMLARSTFRTLISFNMPFLVTEHFIDSPLAGPVAVVFYTIGSLLALFHLRQRRFALLILWFGFNLFAYSIIDTFPPRYQHMVGLIPVMALFIGLGMVACIDLLAHLIPRMSAVLRTVLLAALIAGVGISGVYNYFVTMPASYYPGFEQIISWYGLYAKGQSIDYVYNSQERSDFMPYIFREIRKDVPFTMIPAADFAARPEKYPLSQNTLLFYAPATSDLVLPALIKQYGDQIKETIYKNRAGLPIGIGAWLAPMPISLPTSLSELLADSYLRPVGWLLIMLVLLLVFFATVRHKWLKSIFIRLSAFSAWLSNGSSAFVPFPENQPGLQMALSQTPLTNQSSPMPIPHGLSEPAQPDASFDNPSGSPRTPSGFQSLQSKNASSRAGLNRFAAVLQDIISREQWVPVSVLLTVLVAAFTGQQGLLDHKLEPGIWYLLGAALLFLIYSLICGYTAPAAASDEKTSETLIPSSLARQCLVFSALLVTTANLILLQVHDPQQPYWISFALWITSSLLFLLAFIPKLHGKTASFKLQEHWKKWLPLAVILLVGFAARFYLLGLIPNIMENDEGDVGVQTVKVLSGQLTNMFQIWRSTGTLFYFMMAVPVKWLGPTLFAIRLDTAILGFLALPVVYVLARSLFDHKIALVSTALLAVSHLDIQFSRVSAAASSVDPLLAALTLLLIYRGLQSRRALEWVLAGTVMGLGLYFYVGTRVLIFIVLAFLILLAVFNRRLVWQNRQNILGLAAAYLLIAAPMLLLAANHPDQFNSRMNQVGIFQSGWLGAEMLRQHLPAWRILLQQFTNSFLILNYFDPVWFYNATVPALGPISGAAFVCGLLVSLARIRDTRFALLNCWFWVTLITGQVLAVDPTASAYRTLGLIPAVCILAAVALVRLADGIFTNWPRIKRAAPLVLITLALIFEGGWNLWNYFGVWAPANRYGDPNAQLASWIGDYLGQQPAGSTAYIANTPAFSASGWSSIDYLRKTTVIEDLNSPVERALAEIKPSSRMIFIFLPARQNDLALVQQAYPGGQVSRRYQGGKLVFTIYQK